MRTLFSVFLITSLIGQIFSIAHADDNFAQTDRLTTLYEIIKTAGWGENSDNEERLSLYKQVEDLIKQDAQTINELQENADAMKAKEQSTENKLLGGATMAATGIGGMQAMSALAEKNADEDAETAMRAYLATFSCKYGNYRVTGGEKNVVLPGGNELISLYSEYVNLANDLKARKTALDMRPGIETEPILDAATSGLYDDISIGKTSGAFTSLARALQNPDGPDAIAWAAQKEETAKQLKTGLTTAGIGAAAGIIGNQIINKNSPTERSGEIMAKREKLSKTLDETIQRIIQTCNSEIATAQATAAEIKSKITNWQSKPQYADFVSMAESAEPLKSESDITKLNQHPVCN